jgi:hypothetical protein
MRPITTSLTVTTAVANAVCASQTRVGAGALVINGTLATGGVATLAAAYAVSVTSSGNDSALTYTITGTNAAGNVVSQAITGPNTTTVFTTTAFRTVTGVSVSGSTVGNITVGFGSFAVTAPIPLDYFGDSTVSLQVVTTGGAAYTVQQTLDNVQDATVTPTWFDHPDVNLVNSTSNRQGNYAFIPTAVRLRQAVGTSTATLTITQSGIMG